MKFNNDNTTKERDTSNQIMEHKITDMMNDVRFRFNHVLGFGKRKIFCVGFNKMGTSSLDFLFKEIGLSSTHNIDWPVHSHLHEFNKSVFYHQCYSDGEKSDFIALEKNFPKSLFILNNRNERDWLYSRIKHILRYERTPEASRILSDQSYGWMARDFVFNEELAIRKWICERRIYLAQVREYFNGRADFLEIDITVSKDWEAQLLSFLDNNLYGYKRVQGGSGNTIHANKREEKHVHNQSSLTKYKQLVDQILQEMSD